VSIESLALSSEVLCDACSFKDGKALWGLKDGKLPYKRFGQKRVHRGCLTVFLVRLLLLFSACTFIWHFGLFVDVNLGVFNVQEFGSDANQA